MSASIQTIKEIPKKVASANLQHLVIGLFAILMLTIPLGAGVYPNTVMIDVGFYSIVTMGLILLMGFAGQISLGHAAFFGCGAYASAILTTNYNLPPWPALLLAATITGAMAAIIGSGDIMPAAQNSFISSTYWTERIGPSATLATIGKHQRCNVPKHLIKIGKRVQSGWKSAADRHGLKISIYGIPPLAHFSFDYENGQTIRTLFTQEMLDKSFLATSAFYASYAHQDHHIESYLKALDEIFGFIAEAIEKDEVEKLLKENHLL